jgi:hypothetical protein
MNVVEDTVRPQQNWRYDSFDHQEPDFNRTGVDYGTLYHAGPSRITKIDPTKLQKMDPGEYGKGFYVASDKRFALMGGVSVGLISEFRFVDSARILVVRRDNGIIHAMRQFYFDIESANKKDEQEIADMIVLLSHYDSLLNKVVRLYAARHRYDAVDYKNSEIVVTSFDKLLPLTPL